jgi:tetratricopeptide (TPR) repeat protein
LFDPSSFQWKAGGRGSSLSRPVFHPSKRRDESTEKTMNAAADLGGVKLVEEAGMKVEILLALSALYAKQAAEPGPGKGDDALLHDAFDCVYFAREIAPTHLLPDIHAALASLSVQSRVINAAVRHYESALVLNSHHCASLIGLAQIENRRTGGNLVLAYGYLMSALQVDATSHSAWFEMGCILQAQQKHGAAAEHFATAIEMERTAPITSFEKVERKYV